jgi:hypothetical protein
MVFSPARKVNSVGHLRPSRRPTQPPMGWDGDAQPSGHVPACSAGPFHPTTPWAGAEMLNRQVKNQHDLQGHSPSSPWIGTEMPSRQAKSMQDRHSRDLSSQPKIHPAPHGGMDWYLDTNPWGGWAGLRFGSRYQSSRQHRWRVDRAGLTDQECVGPAGHLVLDVPSLAIPTSFAYNEFFQPGLFKELCTQKYLGFAELKGRKFRINNKPTGKRRT